jgi:hypothetical protein
MSPTGLTQDAGWEVGVSRTLPVELDVAWDFLVSHTGLRLWLGEVSAPLAKGAEYATRDGTTGEVRCLRPRDRVRLTWSPKAASNQRPFRSQSHPPGTGPRSASTLSASSARTSAGASANTGARRWTASRLSWRKPVSQAEPHGPHRRRPARMPPVASRCPARPAR